MTELLHTVLNGLMSRYKERVEDVDIVLEAMLQKGLVASFDAIDNDHIAFRTMGVPHLGIKSLEKIFLAYGYEKRDAYDFKQKKLSAYWYAPPKPIYPRIFISELRVEELSEKAQRVIRSYTDEVQADPVDSLDLNDPQAVDEFLHSPLWRTPTYEDFQVLAQESEYASWVIYNRYYLNHFTISVHNLPEGYNTIELFNAFLESIGCILNDSGGKAKVSPDGNLIQSSTVAQIISAQFDDGKGGVCEHPISGSYVEFAERRVLEEFNGLDSDKVERKHRRDGFEAANANAIFESTYNNQTNKR